MALAPSIPVSVLVLTECSAQFSLGWDGTGRRAYQELDITYPFLTGEEHFLHSHSQQHPRHHLDQKIISSQRTRHTSVLKTALAASVQRHTSWFTSPDWNYPKKKCTFFAPDIWAEERVAQAD